MESKSGALEDAVSAGVNRLCLDLGFMTRAVMTLGRMIEPDYDGYHCDGTSLVFGSDWILSRQSSEPNLIPRSIAHSILHCILGHSSPANDPLLDLAEDIVVGYILDSLDVPCIRTSGRDDRMYAAEKIFKNAGSPVPKAMVEVLREASQWRITDYMRMFHVDNHRGRESVSDIGWSELSKQMMVEVEGFSQKLEGRSDALLRILRIRNRRRHDYRAFLRKFMTRRSSIRENPDEFDYIYYSYGLRMYGNLPLIDSVEYSDNPHVEEFVIAIDTSGSTMKGPVMRFIEEAFDVLRQSGLGNGGSELHIIQCDDEIRSDVIIRNEMDMKSMMGDFHIMGGGGTDFRPVFRYVDGLRSDGALKNLKGLMYFTDGMGTYPETRPEYDTAFVFCDDGCRERQVPPWAMRITVDTDDLMTDSVKHD